MNKPLFQIVEASPLYCAITDGFIGRRNRLLPMAYHTEAYARRLARLLEHRDYADCGGELSFFVIRAGDPVRRPVLAPLPDDFDDMPF